MPAMVISRAFWTALKIVGVPSIARFRIADEVERYPGDEPPPPYRGIGRPRKAKGFEARIPATEARFILEGLERDSWCVVAWRKGTRGVLRELCTRIRVYRVGYRGTHVESGGWLIGETSCGWNPGRSQVLLRLGNGPKCLWKDIVELAHSRAGYNRAYPTSVVFQSHSGIKVGRPLLWACLG